jgi:hypothetical protein
MILRCEKPIGELRFYAKNDGVSTKKGVIAPGILYLRLRLRRMVGFTSRSLYSRGNKHRYPSDRRMGGFQGRSGCCRDEQNLSLLLGLNSDSPFVLL